MEVTVATFGRPVATLEVPEGTKVCAVAEPGMSVFVNGEEADGDDVLHPGDRLTAAPKVKAG